MRASIRPGTGQTFTEGELTTRPPVGMAFRPDTIIWAEPSALLLYFYRRTALWPNVVRGNLTAGHALTAIGANLVGALLLGLLALRSFHREEVIFRN